MSSILDVFTYIGVGVVVGALVGFILGVVWEPDAWLVGGVAGVAGSIAGWFVVRQISASAVDAYRASLPPDDHER